MAKNTDPIVLNQFNMGGLSDSPWSGPANSMDELVGIDLHSTPGVITPRPAMVLVSDPNTDVDEFVKVSLECSTGDVYHFSSESGKVWKQTTSNVFSLVHTIVPDVGSAATLGAAEYGRFIYVFTQSRVHRIPVSGLSDWATNFVSNWAPLNLEQDEIGGTGQTYAITGSVNEGATHKQTFTSFRSPIESVAINLNAVSTGNVTVTIHDSSNAALGSKTVNAASLTTGWNLFTFSSVLYPIIGAEYHIHVSSTVADGTVKSLVASDLEGGNVRIYTTSDSEYHPTRDLNGILYIGDRHFVHQIEDETFTARALDVSAPLRVKCLGALGTDLLVGTIINSTLARSQIFRWDTYSVSYYSSDPIDEVGIHAFLQSDNYVFVYAGYQGNIYIYNGEQLEPFFKIPGAYSPTKTAVVHPNAVATLAGLTLLGVSNVAGNPTKQGIYLIGRNQRNYPYVIDLSFPISQRSGGEFVLTGVEIGSIVVSGSKVICSWKNGSDVGIDVTDYDQKLDKAYISSRYHVYSREKLMTMTELLASYYQMPSNCDIVLSTSRNYEAYVTDEQENDTKRLVKQSTKRVEFNVLKVKAVFRTDGANAPVLESIKIILDG